MTEGAAGDIGTLAMLLGRCLSLKPDNSEAAALRADLALHWDRFAAHCEELRLMPVVAERLLKRNLMPAGRNAEVATSIAANLTRRRIMAARLDELVAAFNEEGRAVARLPKSALPADWTVVYEDVDAWLRPRGEPLERRQLILAGTSSTRQDG